MSPDTSFMMRSFLVTALVLAAVGAEAQQVANPNKALIDRYCVTCHNQRLKTAKVEFDSLELAHPEKNAVVWERAIRKLRGGMMPPPGARGPRSPMRRALAAYLETTPRQGSRHDPNPGSVRIHRLNRAEYANAMRDLFAWTWRCRTLAAQRRHQRGLRQHRQRAEGFALVPRPSTSWRRRAMAKEAVGGARSRRQARTTAARLDAGVSLPPGARVGVTGRFWRRSKATTRSAPRAVPPCSPSTAAWWTRAAGRI
jgi:hypothetical protein